MGHVRFWRSIFSWVPVTPPLLISFQVGQAESVLSSLQALKASKDTWQQHGFDPEQVGLKPWVFFDSVKRG